MSPMVVWWIGSGMGIVHIVEKEIAETTVSVVLRVEIMEGFNEHTT